MHSQGLTCAVSFEKLRAYSTGRFFCLPTHFPSSFGDFALQAGGNLARGRADVDDSIRVEGRSPPLEKAKDIYGIESSKGNLSCLHRSRQLIGTDTQIKIKKIFPYPDVCFDFVSLVSILSIYI